jgi:hypothetical protein
MGHDPHSPITTSRQLDWPKGHRIYTTTRTVPAEYPIPLIGATMAAQLGNTPHPYASNIIIDVREGPIDNATRTLSIDHTAIPAGTHTKYQTVACVFPAIYPNNTAFFPGGSMRRSRNVLGKVQYQFSQNPSSWLAEGAIWNFTDPSSGPFEVESWLAQAANEIFIDGDGNGRTVGEFLNGTFIAQDTVHNGIDISIPGDLFYQIAASRPSATTYAGWVANKTEIMISRTVDDWYGDILMKRTVLVRAQ